MEMKNWITVHWEKKTPDTVRYYLVYLHQDLWGAWILTRVWGGVQTSLEGVIHTPVESHQAGVQALEELHELRRRHHYALKYATPEWKLASVL